MDCIHKFFECLLPTTICNLECEYCYIIQEKRRGMENISLDYSVEHIIKALSKKRLDGTCYFSICGTGETFLQKELVPLVVGLLKEGHYVNITTNGTISRKMQELLDEIGTMSSRLNISFSFHYIELVKRNLLNVFFDNVKLVREKGCSYIVQLNLYDGYYPYINEIKKLCMKEVGALPQVAVTRLEPEGDVQDNVKLHTQLGLKKYLEVGDSFESPLFDFTMKNFNVKRKEFCYAGDWSFNLDLKTGNLKACYHSGKVQNIFRDISKPIVYAAVGHFCCSRYCVNSSHFLSLGVIPSIKTPTYADIRNRPSANWYNPVFAEVLGKQFADYKKKYGILKMAKCDIVEGLRLLKRSLMKRLQ